jgi:hypothetical protein
MLSAEPSSVNATACSYAILPPWPGGPDCPTPGLVPSAQGRRFTTPWASSPWCSTLVFHLAGDPQPSACPLRAGPMQAGRPVREVRCGSSSHHGWRPVAKFLASSAGQAMVDLALQWRQPVQPRVGQPPLVLHYVQVLSRSDVATPSRGGDSRSRGAALGRPELHARP